jgi:hypothetical protein
VKTEFNAENLTKLKKLGKNPKFAPIVTCDKIDVCKQYKSGGKDVNCSNIVIGRDRESLEIAILCGKKHKGALPLPFDDGTSIVRPRKKKGAAMANPSTFPIVASMNPVQDYLNEIEKLFKRHKLGVYGDARLLAIEDRLISLERASGINVGIVSTRVCSIQGESPDTDEVNGSSGSVNIDQIGSVQASDNVLRCGSNMRARHNSKQ